VLGNKADVVACECLQEKEVIICQKAMEPVRTVKDPPEEAGVDANPAVTIKWTKEPGLVPVRVKALVAAKAAEVDRAGGTKNNL
jgi:hypothetical protein